MCATLLKLVISVDIKLDIVHLQSIIQQAVVYLGGQDVEEPGEKSYHFH